MTDLISARPALAVPVSPAPRAGPRPGLIALYVLAYAGAWTSVQAPVILSLPLRVEELAPNHTAGALSLALTLGALVALASPLFGRLSDRTTSRFGRRRPWLVAGTAISVLGALVLAAATTLPVLIVGWCLVKLGFGLSYAVLIAVLVDIAPAGRRGWIAGLLGICPPLGAAAGAWIVHGVAGSRTLLFLAPACLAACTALVFVLVLREPQRPVERRRPLLAGLAVNLRRHPDFGWAWLSRFAFFFAVASIVSFQALYLRHELERPMSEVPQLIATATLAKTIAIIAASLVCGQLSDRIGRRKPFVCGAALLFAAGPLVLILSGTYPGFVLGLAIMGLAIGTYAPVDLALVIDVLPDRDAEAAKDLGVLNLATSLPGSLAPALAPLFLLLGGGGYVVLFAAASVVAVVAALTVVPIRGVR